MSIPQAIPSVVPQVIFFIASQFSWERASIGCSTLESGFYHFVKGGNLEEHPVVKQISEISIAYIHEIQALFNLANLGIACIYAQKLLREIQGNFSFSVLDTLVRYKGGIILVPLIAGTAFLIEQYLQNQNKEKKNEVGFTEIETTQQKIAKSIHITKIVLNLALCSFANNRFLLGLGLIESGYSLIKNRELKWISFSKTLPLQLEVIPEATQAKITYNMLVLPVNELSAKEECSICFDPNLDMAFCTNHVYHQKCIEQTVAAASSNFLNAGTIRKIETKHSQNGRYTHSSYNYSVTIPADNLPKCPDCRDIPIQNWVTIEISDRLQGLFQARVNVVRPPISLQPLFEKLYAIYNVAQAGLSYLQKYPELAVKIFTIQRVLLVTDFLGYGLTLHYLYNKLKEKYENHKPEKISLSIAIGAMTTALLSYFAILKLNAYLKSTLILKEILGTLPISPEKLKEIEISWGTPLSHQFMQCLYINRIVALTAFSFFSKQQMINSLSAAAQLLSFAGISQLQWIEFTQLLGYPLEKIVETGGSLTQYLNTSSLKTLKVKSFFLIDPSCRAEASHLQSVVSSIYIFMNQIFDKSQWDRYWAVTYRNGVETSRRLIYTIALKDNPIAACACKIIPTLTHLSMSAVDSVYGYASVLFKGLHLPGLF